MNTRRAARLYGGLGIAVIVVVVAGTVLLVNSDDAPKSNSVVSVTQITEKKKAEPVTLSGTGDAATEAFSLSKGSATFKITHSGTKNFMVNVYDQDAGTFYDGLLSEMGAYSGSRVLPINTTGQYRLDVVADGPWTVTITQE